MAPVMITKLLHFMFKAQHELIPNFLLDSLVHLPKFLYVFYSGSDCSLCLKCPYSPSPIDSYPASKTQMLPPGEAFPDVPRELIRPGFRLLF